MNIALMGATILVGSLLIISSPVWSDDRGKKHEEENLADLVKDAKVTVDQAIKTAMEKVQGTVVEAELEKKHGKTVWEVEIVGGDGKITEVHIDAGSGDVMDTEKKEEKKDRKKHK